MRTGLQIDDAVDERADAARSSRAAAHHLADLFAEFGGDATLLAVVSYNFGAGNTRELLHQISMEKGSWRSGRRSYWHLYRMHRLPQETMDYVPRLVAAALLDDSRP